MKVSKLSGARLDYWVAMAEGEKPYYDDPVIAPNAFERGDQWAWLKQGEFGSAKEVPKYSTDWARGGPIIERERMAVMPRDIPGLSDPWSSVIWLDPEGVVIIQGFGPTPLIAAMRAFVASKLGEEVPDEVVE